MHILRSNLFISTKIKENIINCVFSFYVIYKVDNCNDNFLEQKKTQILNSISFQYEVKFIFAIGSWVWTHWSSGWSKC